MYAYKIQSKLFFLQVVFHRMINDMKTAVTVEIETRENGPMVLRVQTEVSRNLVRPSGRSNAKCEFGTRAQETLRSEKRFRTTRGTDEP
jgi:hypothetical protein